MDEKKKAYIFLHLAILLFAITAILGDFIKLNAFILVWWRMLITCISLAFLIKKGKNLRKLTRKDILIFLGIGWLVAIHWVTFFGSVKESNVSVTLVCLSTTSFMTAFIEPFVLKTRFNKMDLLFGALMIPGMALIVKNLDFSLYYGAVLGLISALFAAIFSVLNKKNIEKADSFTITFLELGGGWIFLSLLLPFLPTENFWPSPTDWIGLLILSILCTTIAYSLMIQSLRQLSAFVSNLSINLEPVYGILLAIVFLGEQKELDPSFYVGFSLMIGAIFGYPIIKLILKKRAKTDIA